MIQHEDVPAIRPQEIQTPRPSQAELTGHAKLVTGL